jgi:general secretion pathway protein E/type IV pilus assembly protein PilB
MTLPHLGETLLAENAITDDHLRIALYEQREQGGLLGQVLVRLGFLDEATLARVLAERTGAGMLSAAALTPDMALLADWPKASAERCKALPLYRRDGALHVAVADPYDLAALDELRRAFPGATPLQLHVAEVSALLESIDSLYGPLGALDALLAEIEGDGATVTVSDAPHVRLLDWLLADAVRQGASDIHLEPEATFVRLRYRIDGRLHEVRSLHRDHWGALSHRLKILAGMNIADQRSIQDGRFCRSIGGSDIDFRVALMPSVWGETIVVRLLDHRRGLLSLDELGFDRLARRALHDIMARPEGLMLVTGPTGSGKTTTLYALLKQLATIDVHVATLEEPVEYQLPLLRQTAVAEEQGLSFAAGVRGILRMDPDIVFIGEIRDSETAQMALRAAMTGHKVFSTLHSVDALGAFARLIDLGVSPKMLTGNLSGLMAQRLVRRLCPACKKERPATPDEALALGANPSEPPRVAEAEGCPACAFRGTKGRLAISEILPLTPEIDDLVAADAPRLTLLRVAQKAGFRRMRDEGARRVLAGDIAFADLARVLDMRRGM